MSTLGIDISNNNGSIDFAKVKAAGVEYVYVKATEGQSFRDKTMAPFLNACKELGLKVGAYHFLVATSEPEAQAQNFYAMIKDYEWDLVPMMDVETMEGFTEEMLCDYVKRFKATFEQLSPLTLGIYSYTSFIEHLDGASVAIKAMPFWEANYNNDPWNLPDNFFTNRIGHQYTETGSIDGVAEKCDVDEFTDGVLLAGDTIPGEWLHGSGPDASKYWYRHSDGTWTENGWEQINGKWYYFDADGWMVYDWKKDGNYWYFLGGINDGSMKVGWVLSDGKWYYFNANGAMVTGWVQVDGKWYYLDHSGAMQTGWLYLDNNWYCMYSDGAMICDTAAYGYSFNTNGVASKIS